METGGGVEVFERPLPLDCGQRLPGFRVAYATYGSLSPARDNAVLVLHGLTADQHAGGTGPDGRPGWWSAAIGPGKPIDTDRWFVVCPNALGGWGGSSGPATPDPRTGRPYGMRFPVCSVGDNVAAQAALAGRLGIGRFRAAVGGCFGGFQVYEWMARRPHMLDRAAAITATPRTSAHNTALWSVLRAAIASDPAWAGGDYYDGAGPRAGLELMAKIGALFWFSRETLETKFGRHRLPDADPDPQWGFAPETELEAFFASVGKSAAGRLDANGLLYLTRAIDYFDMARGRRLAEAFARWRGETLLVAYRSDWRYPAAEMAEVADALAEVGAPCRLEVLDSAAGHGAFLHDMTALGPLLADFLDREPAHVAHAG
jgi:homoserine O-acetyltransferase